MNLHLKLVGFIEIHTVVRSRLEQQICIGHKLKWPRSISLFRGVAAFYLSLHFIFSGQNNRYKSDYCRQKQKKARATLTHCFYLQTDISRKSPLYTRGYGFALGEDFFRFFKTILSLQWLCEKVRVYVRTTRCSPAIILFQRDKHGKFFLCNSHCLQTRRKSNKYLSG